MKTKTIVLFLTTLFAASLIAQQTPTSQTPTPPPAGTPSAEAKPPDAPQPEQESTYDGIVDFGLQGAHNDTGSAKFQEYRDVPTGAVLPFFRLRTSQAGWDFNLTGENAARTDQHYSFRADTPWVRINGDYNQIPHRWGVGHTLETRTSNSSWEISDVIQRSFQTALEQQFATNKAGITFPFLNNLVAPALATANAVDIELVRKRGFVDFNIFPEAAVDTHVTYFAESRSGTRGAGTSFGFSNVVETPEPINYRTTDVGVNAELPLARGLVRGGVHINTFRDELSSYTFDNPFRVVSTTDASAYTAPGSGSINGPSYGRITTPPDNEALNLALGGLYKLPLNSRISADLNLGRWHQNDDFIPYTTNTAVLVPFNASDVNTLPQRSLHGKVNTTGLNAQITSSPVKHLNLSARWRYYDFDNQTDRVSLPGYMRFDSAWEAIPRISVPYSFRRNRTDLTAQYDIGTLGDVEVGFRSETRHHDYREVERDTENVFRVGGDIRPATWVMFRASLEFGNRGINGYDPELSEEASFRDPQAATQPPTLRRFDVNERHVSRLVSMLQLTPFDGPVTVDFNYIHNLDKYKNADYGLRRWRSDSFTAEGSYAPTDRWNVMAFYSNEYLDGFQVGEQNSNGVLSLNPMNDWIADNSDRVHTVGAGFNFGIVPQKVDLNILSRWQRANGFARLLPLVTPSNLNPQSIPNFDDTNFWNTSAEVAYHVVRNVELAVGGWIEKYRLNDAEQSGLPNYVPGSFFLAPNNLDYRGNVAYVRATFHW